MLNYFRVVVSLGTFLATATGITLDAFQIVDISPRWWPLCTFFVFCLFVGWFMCEQSGRIKSLENQRPVAIIEPFCKDAERYLKITNKGEKGKFVADIKVVRSENDVDLMGETYKGYWKKANSDESELMNGRSDLLHIATEYTCVINGTTGTDFGLYLFDDSKRQPIENRLVIGRPHCWLKVSVTAEPALKNGYVVQYYELKYNDFTKLKLPMLNKRDRFSRLFKRNPIIRLVLRK